MNAADCVREPRSRLEAQVATGYASRAHYVWVGGGVQHFADRSGDRPGDSRLLTFVCGYRPAPLRTESGKPDLRFYVEATAEDRSAHQIGGVTIGSGERSLFVGPTTLLLHKAFGIEGGVLFPAYERVDPGAVKEHVRVAVDVVCFFRLKQEGPVKLHTIGAIGLMLAVATSAQAELRHVELKTLGMD